MKKYYIEDLSTNESKELSYNEFTQSVLYNANESIEYECNSEEETDKFLEELRFFLASLQSSQKSNNIQMNGFIYSFEEMVNNE